MGLGFLLSLCSLEAGAEPRSTDDFLLKPVPKPANTQFLYLLPGYFPLTLVLMEGSLLYSLSLHSARLDKLHCLSLLLQNHLLYWLHFALIAITGIICRIVHRGNFSRAFYNDTDTSLPWQGIFCLAPRNIIAFMLMSHIEDSVITSVNNTPTFFSFSLASDNPIVFRIS